MQSKAEKAFKQAVAAGAEIKTRKVSNTRYQRYAFLDGVKIFDDIRRKKNGTRKGRRAGRKK